MKITELELAEQHLVMRAELKALQKVVFYMIGENEKMDLDAFLKVYQNMIRQELVHLGSHLEWTDEDWGGQLKDLLG